jgi:hypothetical protein
VTIVVLAGISGLAAFFGPRAHAALPMAISATTAILQTVVTMPILTQLPTPGSLLRDAAIPVV